MCARFLEPTWIDTRLNSHPYGVNSRDVVFCVSVVYFVQSKEGSAGEVARLLVVDYFGLFHFGSVSKLFGRMWAVLAFVLFALITVPTSSGQALPRFASPSSRVEVRSWPRWTRTATFPPGSRARWPTPPRGRLTVRRRAGLQRDITFHARR